jgi:hypothetical protein
MSYIRAKNPLVALRAEANILGDLVSQSLVGRALELGGEPLQKDAVQVEVLHPLQVPHHRLGVVAGVEVNRLAGGQGHLGRAALPAAQLGDVG